MHVMEHGAENGIYGLESQDRKLINLCARIEKYSNAAKELSDNTAEYCSIVPANQLKTDIEYLLKRIQSDLNDYFSSGVDGADDRPSS